MPIRAQLEEGEKGFLIHLITPLSYMLRQPAYLWFNSVFNVIDMKSLKVRTRIYPEALWNHGRMWLTYLLVVSIAMSPLAYPDAWSFDPPLVITPARFHKKKRAELAMHCLARSWYCTSLDKAQLENLSSFYGTASGKRH